MAESLYDVTSCLTETHLRDRDLPLPLTENPSTETSMWTENPLDRDFLWTEEPPDRDPLDREPSVDREPPGERTPWAETPCGQRPPVDKESPRQRPPPPTESLMDRNLTIPPPDRYPLHLMAATAAGGMHPTGMHAHSQFNS